MAEKKLPCYAVHGFVYCYVIRAGKHVGAGGTGDPEHCDRLRNIQVENPYDDPDFRPPGKPAKQAAIPWSHVPEVFHLYHHYRSSLQGSFRQLSCDPHPDVMPLQFFPETPHQPVLAGTEPFTPTNGLSTTRITSCPAFNERSTGRSTRTATWAQPAMHPANTNIHPQRPTFSFQIPDCRMETLPFCMKTIPDTLGSVNDCECERHRWNFHGYWFAGPWKCKRVSFGCKPKVCRYRSIPPRPGRWRCNRYRKWHHHRRIPWKHQPHCRHTLRCSVVDIVGVFLFRLFW